MEVNNSRFDRIEKKLDFLAEAFIKLVKIDTKMEGFSQYMATQDKRLDSQSERIDRLAKEVKAIGKTVDSNSGTKKFAERVFYIILAGAFSAILYSMRG